LLRGDSQTETVKIAPGSNRNPQKTPLPSAEMLPRSRKPMVEALSHGAVLRRSRSLSLAEAKAEVTRAVLAYLHA
jgi:hypothetical protein